LVRTLTHPKSELKNDDIKSAMLPPPKPAPTTLADRAHEKRVF